MAAPTRPVLRYHGGKWRLAPWIIDHFPAHRVYVEPFGGAASVLLRKPRAYAEVYNDLDGEVVNLFRVLRDRELAQQLEAVCRLTPFSRSEFALSYEPADDPVEQARRTLFRSFAGFGSVGASGRKTGFRSNVTRNGTVPAHDWATLAEAIPTFVERLQGVVIECEPALDVIRRYDGPETLHYIDPPYPFSTRTATAQWDRNYRHEMTDDEHRELAAVLRHLEGMVIISGYPCELYDDELYSDWTRVCREALADGARLRTECLWLSPSVIERQKQMSLWEVM